MNIFQLEVKLCCGNISKQKCYGKSDDPPRCLKEHPKLSVFFTGALISISMSKSTPNHTYIVNCVNCKSGAQPNSDSRNCHNPTNNPKQLKATFVGVVLLSVKKPPPPPPPPHHHTTPGIITIRAVLDNLGS
jgi:hypothetical protein